MIQSWGSKAAAGPSLGCNQVVERTDSLPRLLMGKHSLRSPVTPLFLSVGHSVLDCPRGKHCLNLYFARLILTVIFDCEIQHMCRKLHKTNALLTNNQMNPSVTSTQNRRNPGLLPGPVQTFNSSSSHPPLWSNHWPLFKSSVLCISFNFTPTGAPLNHIGEGFSFFESQVEEHSMCSSDFPSLCALRGAHVVGSQILALSIHWWNDLVRGHYAVSVQLANHSHVGRFQVWVVRQHNATDIFVHFPWHTPVRVSLGQQSPTDGLKGANRCSGDTYGRALLNEAAQILPHYFQQVLEILACIPCHHLPLSRLFIVNYVVRAARLFLSTMHEISLRNSCIIHIDYSWIYK